MNPRFAPPRAAYLHVPFCRHRCGYCNFTLVAGRDDLISGYLAALEQELSGLQTPQPMDTIYVGGGTPSHLPPAALEALLDLITRWLPPQPGAEFSVEANPLDVTAEKARLLASRGVTRISLGAQSFQDRKLQLLERDHRRGDIEGAVASARSAGLALNLDLIFAVPDELEAEWQDDLRQAVALQPDHLSTYALTFERGTSFWSRRLRGELQPVPDERELAHYVTGMERLREAGYEQYEVSNFARPDARCRHNEAYWTGATYWGFGPGAARHVQGVREVNHRSTTTWLRRIHAGLSPVAEREMLPPRDAARERLVFGLRRLEGINAAQFAAETGFTLEALAGHRRGELEAAGLIEWTPQSLRLSRAGLLLADAVATRLLQD